MKSVQEIATMFGVTANAVRKWIVGGLPYKLEKKIGSKARMMIDPPDVIAYHKSKEIIKPKGE